MADVGWLGDVLRSAGCRVVEEGDWLRRGVSGTFAPIGVLWHHTAAFSSSSRPAPSLDVVIGGRPDLQGPLCQALVDYHGVFHLISARRANHAGPARASGPIPAGDGNTMLIGWEIDYQGVDQRMTTAQYEASVQGTAAVLRRLGRDASYARGHRETSTTGKIDPGHVDVNTMRVDVATAMLPRRVATGLDVAAWGPDRLDLVARSGSDHLLHRYYDGINWSAWRQVGNQRISSDPSITSWGPRRLDVFARNERNELVHVYFNGTGWFDEILPGTITSGPAAVSWDEGRIDVAARGGDHQLVHWYYDRSAGGWAGRWDHRGGALSSDPTLSSWAPGRLDVFAADDKNRLVHLYFSNGAWSTWETWSSEDALTSSPDAVSWGPNRIDVAARNANGQLGHVYYNAGVRSSETLGQWKLSGPPAVASRGAGRLDVFFPSTTQRLIQYSRNASGWMAAIDRGPLPVG